MAKQESEHAFVLVYFTDHKGVNQQRAERVNASEVDGYVANMMRNGFTYKGTKDALMVVPPHHILGCRISVTEHDD